MVVHSDMLTPLGNVEEEAEGLFQETYTQMPRASDIDKNITISVLYNIYLLIKTNNGYHDYKQGNNKKKLNKLLEGGEVVLRDTPHQIHCKSHPESLSLYLPHPHPQNLSVM